MTRVDAIYQDGVFRPLGPVGLAENQRVALSVEPLQPVMPSRQNDAMTWLEEADRLRNTLAAKYGVLPDSTLDIASDRAR